MTCNLKLITVKFRMKAVKMSCLESGIKKIVARVKKTMGKYYVLYA